MQIKVYKTHFYCCLFPQDLSVLEALSILSGAWKLCWLMVQCLQCLLACDVPCDEWCLALETGAIETVSWSAWSRLLLELEEGWIASGDVWPVDKVCGVDKPFVLVSVWQFAFLFGRRGGLGGGAGLLWCLPDTILLFSTKFSDVILHCSAELSEAILLFSEQLSDASILHCSTKFSEAILLFSTKVSDESKLKMVGSFCSTFCSESKILIK